MMMKIMNSMNKHLYIIIGLLLAPLFCMAQGSKPAEESKVYRLDSLEEVVASAMQQEEYKDYIGMFKAYFAAIDQKVTPKEWAERMKADAMTGIFDNFCTTDEHELYQLYQEQDQPDSLRQKVKSHYEAMIAKYGHLFPGKPAPALTFTDKEGKEHSLQSFKGKVLLVDIWGTWCAPCIAEMPYLAALQKKYADREDVMIMSIACDKKAEKWKAYLAKHPTTWHQYLVTDKSNDQLDKAYFCEGIPRFIIIDRKGNIVSADAMRPSDKAFDEYFSKIANK
jgi:thiol-disulfide isomerase/thioredoxin